MEIDPPLRMCLHPKAPEAVTPFTIHTPASRIPRAASEQRRIDLH